MSKDPDALGLFTKIKLFFGGVGTLGAGVFLLKFPPEDLVKEVPWHRELGIAFLVFGGLFLLVFLLEGARGKWMRALNFRVKSLLGVLAAGGIAVLIAWYLVPRTHNAWRLAQDGKATTAEVIRTTSLRVKKKTTYRHRIRYDGHLGWAELGGMRRQGSREGVIYLPGEPDVVMKGSPGDGFLDLVDKTVGRWWAIGSALLFVYLAIVAMVKAKHFLFGRSEAAVSE